MTEPTQMHSISTNLPDDLWERFDEERRSEDRNIAQHLRRIVRDHFRRQDAEQRRRNLTDVVDEGAVPRPWNDR